MLRMMYLGVASLKIQKNLVQNLFKILKNRIKIFLINFERFSLRFCKILSEAT